LSGINVSVIFLPETRKLRLFNMKIITYNSNSNSLATGQKINSTIEFVKDNVVNPSEKSITKREVKYFLGTVYFAALLYSLFILLT
jgi:hypothetical protein